MSDNEQILEENIGEFDVISYVDEVSFTYTLPGEDEARSIEHALTFIWEDTLEKFLEEHTQDKPYKINRFKRAREQNFFIEQVEGETDDLIDQVQEEISNKMKFGFDFSGQLHNDD